MAGNKKSDIEQLGWMLDGTRPRVGRIERRVAAAVLAAKKEPSWSALFDGLAIAAIGTARAMDRAESIKPDPYAFAQAAKVLVEQLRELRMTPASRTVEGIDAEAQALAALLAEE